MAVGLLGIAMAGCASTAVAPPAVLPMWELANAEPVVPVRLARVRVSYDRPLPLNVTQKLCDEFSVIAVDSPGDWAEVRRRLQLPEPRYPLNFSEGMIIGIVASVGEASRPEWPVQIASVRTREGLGWLEVSFAPGVYYPLKTAGYLELAYVPGLKSVCMVRIAHRTFVIRSPMPVY